MKYTLPPAAYRELVLNPANKPEIFARHGIPYPLPEGVISRAQTDGSLVVRVPDAA